MAELITRQLGRNVGQTAWSNYELGLNDPPYDVVEAAAQLSGLTAAYIAFGYPTEKVDRAEKKVAEAGPEQYRKVVPPEPAQRPLRAVNPIIEDADRGDKGGATGK